MENYEDLSTKQLLALVGGLSNPSKMPGFGYSISAWKCQLGAKLAEQAGTVCHHCYARKGRYVFANVQAALDRRYRSMMSDHVRWIGAMSELLRRKSATSSYFRWHDSGDLQSPEHLGWIAAIANATPMIHHWLPTREYHHVAEFLKQGGVIPRNLCVRLSAHLVDGPPPFKLLALSPQLAVSTVSTEETPDGAHACPARFQGNSCGDCRACWDPDVSHVDYHAH